MFYKTKYNQQLNENTKLIALLNSKDNLLSKYMTTVQVYKLNEKINNELIKNYKIENEKITNELAELRKYLELL